MARLLSFAFAFAMTLPAVGALAQTAATPPILSIRHRGDARASVAGVPPEAIVELKADRLRSEELAPAIWRAIAHGARVVSIDAGAATPEPAWAPAVAAIGRQLDVNGRLFALCRPGPAVRVDAPRPAAFDVALLDAGRSWVLIATNVSAARVRGVAHLPAAVPYAMWLNLLGGSTTAMLEEAQGPRWVFTIEPFGVRVLVIDKTLR